MFLNFDLSQEIVFCSF